MNSIKTLTYTGIAMAAFALTAGACTSGTNGDDHEEHIGDTYLSFEEWKTTVYQEPDSGIYIVDGDIPIVSERQLIAFYERYVQSGALIVHQSGGTDAKWSDSAKGNLTYCVSNTFGSNKAAAVAAMDVAADVWEAAANVNLIYVSSQDGNCTASNNNVVFDVRPVNSGGQYLARAFFPDQGRSTRNILIDNSAFGNTGQYSLDGIIKHEVGHALGFRHEHTRPQAGTCFEDNNWRELTNYDASSVMHYPQCNGAQTGDLVLTSADREGAAYLYGCGTNNNEACCADNNGSDCGVGNGGGGGGGGGGGADPNSCENQCGNQAPGGCWCDTSCVNYGDCCADYDNECGSGGGGGGSTCNGNSYSGSLSGSGDDDKQPADGNTYQGMKYKYYSGGVSAALSGPGNADFDLYLYRWNGSWQQVDSGTSSSSDESVSNGSSGYYALTVVSYSGSGSYDLCIN